MKLKLSGVGKEYGSGTWGVSDVDIEVGPGIHGLLGPNGAGKSTLMKIVTTVMKPTEGSVYWNDVDIVDSPEAVRSVLGYLPQDPGVYENLTLNEFLEYIGALRGLDSETLSARADEMMRLTNLQDVGDQKLRTFSGGMRQRAGIAQALLNDPELLVIDEPTVGLDPAERVRFRNVLSNLAADRIVLLSTHIVPDIEATANTVALMDSGELLTHTDPATLIDRVDGDVYSYRADQTELEALRETYRICNSVQKPDGVELRLIADSPPETAQRVDPTLEDAYLQLIDTDYAR